MFGMCMHNICALHHFCAHLLHPWVSVGTPEVITGFHDLCTIVYSKEASNTYNKKVEILCHLDAGEAANKLVYSCGIGTTTIYDLKLQKEQIPKFYAETNSTKVLQNKRI